MKKCGRFVAGMFGTSLSLAMLSGAFLMANKGAVETNAAGSYSWKYSNESSQFSLDADKTSYSVKFGDITWQYEGAGKLDYVGSSQNPGGFLQLGKNPNKNNEGPFKGATLTASIPEQYGNAVSKVEILTSSKSGSGEISVSVGGTNIIEPTTTAKWTSTATVSGTAETPLTGDIVITLSESDGAFYLGSINIDFADYETTKYTSIEITGTPTTSEYYVGDTLSTEGLTVTAYNADKSESLDVTNDSRLAWELTKLDTAGDAIEATYTAKYTTIGGEVLSASIKHTVKVTSATPSELKVTGLAAGYGYGDVIDPATIKVEAVMSDGKTVDVTAQVEIAEHEITLADIAAGKYEFTVSYNGVDETVAVTIDEEVLTIAEARESKNEIVFAGTITGITGVYSNSSDVNVYIADSTGAIMLYRFNPTIVKGGELAVGNKIYVVAKTTVYNGLAETAQNGISDLYVSGKGEEIAAKPVTDLTAEGLAGLDSSIISVEGLEYVSGSVGTSSKAGDITLKYGETTVAMRAPTNAAAGVLDEAGLDDWFDKTSGLPFNFTGHLGWYYKPQLAPISMDDFSCPVYDEIKVFIDTYMHMGKNEKDQCLTLFPKAKEAFDKLSETARECFLKYEGDNQEIVSASARYRAWSVAVGDQNAASVIMNTVNENKGTIIAVSAVAALGVAGAAALLISRKKRPAKNK